MVIRIYSHGIHDFCNEGHDRQFMQAKHSFPDVYLMVGIINDKLVAEHNIKTLYTQDERWESVFHCRHVDEVIQDAPWTLTDDFISEHKIDYVAHTDSHNFHLPQDAYDRFKQEKKFLEFHKDSQNLAIPPDGISNHGLATYSDDLEAIDGLNKCSYDFNNRITLEQAKQLGGSMRPTRVYADGIYDMFHPGHARQLRQAKEAFKNIYLMVGVVNLMLRNKIIC